MKFDDLRGSRRVYILKNSLRFVFLRVGCTLVCKFCHTGTQTLVRNLEFHEIVAQVLIASKI